MDCDRHAYPQWTGNAKAVRCLELKLLVNSVQIEQRSASEYCGASSSYDETTSVYSREYRPAIAANSLAGCFLLVWKSWTVRTSYQTDTRQQTTRGVSAIYPGVDWIKGCRNRKDMQRQLPGLYLFSVYPLFDQIIYFETKGEDYNIGCECHPSWPRLSGEKTSPPSVKENCSQFGWGYRYPAGLLAGSGRCKPCRGNGQRG